MHKVKLMVLDPGHFHAALVQKSMYREMDSTVHVFAPAGPEVEAYLKLVNGYNNRAADPTSWNEKLYTGEDYVEKMIIMKPGSLVMLAGNNLRKTDFIRRSVNAGINVYSDKPMAITPAGFEMLKSSFDSAKGSGIMIYDIMTSRYEITNIIERELSTLKGIFGELEKGTLENPAVSKQSTHYFFKTVSGAPLVRPAWYFDTEQEGYGIVDITTHLVDIIQWECFPENELDYTKDIKVLSARRWATEITPLQFKMVTGNDSFPGFLKKDVRDTVLNVYSNGEIDYVVKGIHAKVAVIWDYQAPEGSSDTYYSIMRGTRSNLVIRQGREQQFQPVIYIEPLNGSNNKEFEAVLKREFMSIGEKYPGISITKSEMGWQVNIPDQYKKDHEKQFELVTRKYLDYLRLGRMPAWEISFMLAKYYTTTKALEVALK